MKKMFLLLLMLVSITSAYAQMHGSMCHDPACLGLLASKPVRFESNQYELVLILPHPGVRVIGVQGPFVPTVSDNGDHLAVRLRRDDYEELKDVPGVVLDIVVDKKVWNAVYEMQGYYHVELYVH